MDVLNPLFPSLSHTTVPVHPAPFLPCSVLWVVLVMYTRMSSFPLPDLPQPQPTPTPSSAATGL